ncbi:MAG: polysaccharide-degrading enzyme [Planctomycetia bacterium]|nr:polysaccharide-degrading enzyme [Planctomycetia bacterium]MCC7313764.1 polysaccharide-degrading enzyme [Planctomycetota bacterium]
MRTIQSLPLVRAIAHSICICALFGTFTAARAADFHVGTSQPFSSIGAVPWHTLSPGDTVWIHWRAAPYNEKWVIGRQGTASLPISVRGVPGPSGQRPIIDGQNATTPAPLNYWNEARSVIKVGGSNTPTNDMAQWILIEGLDIRGARPPNTFTGDTGQVQTYSLNAAAIHVELGEHITIRDCIIRDSGNGIFVSSFDEDISRDILIENNYIHSNGNSGSIFEHNTYTAAIGIVYQFNRFGPLASGAGGNNLKDRSAGLVVRYNWIEGGNRQLDLVDAEDSTLIRDHPTYRRTDVYGNVLIEPAGAGNRQIIHYGGDSGTTGDYRKGDLFFYHNTLVSTRTDRTTLVRLSTNDEHCDARNNILYVTTPGSEFAMLDATGVLDLSHNWIKPGWVGAFGGLSGVINNDGTQILGASPGFTNEAGQDFTLTSSSACVDAATALHPTVAVDGAVTRQYVKHQSSMTRTIAGAASDVGAFERIPSCNADIDCDDDCDDDDVPAFVLALIDAEAFAQAYPSCPVESADLNQDTTVNALDIPAFIAAILSATTP